MGKWGDGEMGRWGDGEIGRLGGTLKTGLDPQDSSAPYFLLPAAYKIITLRENPYIDL